MQHKLLVSGDRASFTTLSLDLTKKELNILAEYPAPYNASWVEPVSSQGSIDRSIGLSEGDESGLLYTFEIDHNAKTYSITSQQATLGAPGHFITLCDGSALALATYLGGSIALYPITTTKQKQLLLKDTPRTELLPPFPYASSADRHGPIKSRQRQCHIHQILEDNKGLLYAPDLGSDRVWILRRATDGMDLEIAGWLQCPPGTGARHAVFTPDEELIYVIGELSHTVIAFDLSACDGPAEGIQPIPGFAPNIIPPSVQPFHASSMDSAEICIHPSIPNVLYVSNRWERHIALHDTNPVVRVAFRDAQLPPGDAVAIILLSDDGKQVQKIKHVRTNVDVIRGMRLSGDGRYVVVAGQEGGGVEVYEISGERGDAWTKVAGLAEGVEGGIKHAVWL
ncbi:hypothetical protein BDW74DRAFT_170019 [Aspergillus multicolor]|uniref:lactonase family protein n=1 Tax=Aspergillus multicolor TaxID=41759 RepID=UPI003CCCBC53